MNGETVLQGNGMSQNRTSKRALQSMKKREIALNLRISGFSYRAIAQKMGVRESTVYKWIKKEMTRTQTGLAENAEIIRGLEVERLEIMFEKAFSAAMEGDLAAIDKALRVMERRSKLLGLDAAVRTEITGALLVSQEWIELRTVIVQTLSQYPDAQQAVLAAITQMENDHE